MGLQIELHFGVTGPFTIKAILRSKAFVLAEHKQPFCHKRFDAAKN